MNVSSVAEGEPNVLAVAPVRALHPALFAGFGEVFLGWVSRQVYYICACVMQGERGYLPCSIRSSGRSRRSPLCRRRRPLPSPTCNPKWTSPATPETKKSKRHLGTFPALSCGPPKWWEHANMCRCCTPHPTCVDRPMAQKFCLPLYWERHPSE